MRDWWPIRPRGRPGPVGGGRYRFCGTLVATEAADVVRAKPASCPALFYVQLGPYLDSRSPGGGGARQGPAVAS
eukprot:11182016-Lingulodinium_polyedra.AAC.1